MAGRKNERRDVDDATARRLADEAARLAGKRVGPVSVRKTLAGRRSSSTEPVRVAIETAGLYCPPRGDGR